VSDQDTKTRLQSEVLQLREQVDAFSETSDNAEAINEYSALLGQLATLSDDLKVQVTEIRVARHVDLGGSLRNSLSESEKINFDSSEEALKKFLQHWEQQGYNARQGNWLQNLENAFKALTRNIKDTNRVSWANWIGDLRTSFAVEDYLLDAQQGLDAVEHRRDKFKTDRETFDEKAKKIPDNITAINDLSDIAKNLAALLNQMDHNVPEEVRQFFNYVSTASEGAPITLLTPEVIEYLSDNNALGNFVVKRPGQRRGY
jgi:chromosome segregation ATPase